VDGSSDLATVLRKCRVLAAKLKNNPFKEWVIQELDGYSNAANLPEYRIFHGQCFGTFLGPAGSGAKSVPLRESEILPQARDGLVTVKLREGVAALQSTLDAARKSDTGVRYYWPADAFGFYQTRTIADHLVLAQAWTMISENKLAGVLSTVRNRVLNFVLEIIAENPGAGEAPIGSPPITPARTEQIFYNTINVHGNVANLAGGNVESQTSVNMVKPGDWESLKSFLENAGLPAADIGELKTAVAAEPGARSIEAGRATSSWWAKIEQKLTNGTIKLLIAGGEELLKQGIDNFFQPH